MKSKIVEKPEKIVGYVLLVVGLVVIIPTYFGISIVFTGASAVPKILETPVLSNATTPMGNATIVLPISTADINEIIEKSFPAVNLGLFIGLSVIRARAFGPSFPPSRRMSPLVGSPRRQVVGWLD